MSVLSFKRSLSESSASKIITNSTPELPPTYEDSNVTKRVTFPIYEQRETHILPEYSESVYKVAVVGMKVEWLSPYEPNASRLWKNVIIELNNTQLNFYSLPDSLVKKQSKFKSSSELSVTDALRLTKIVTENKAAYLKNSSLIKSYTLQWAQMGIPTDYSKRAYALRMRVMEQQIIISFTTVESMITWSTSLDLAISLSLDLEAREMPNYKIVPRRRRRRRAATDSILDHRPFIHRLSVSEAQDNSLKNKLKGIFMMKKSVSEDKFKQIENTARDRVEIEAQMHSPRLSEPESLPSLTSSFSSVTEEDVPLEQTFERDVAITDDYDDMYSLHSRSPSSEPSEERDFDEKWSPMPKVVSTKRFVRDSIRCIKVLPGNDPWLGKNMVRNVKGELGVWCVGPMGYISM